MKRAYGVSPMLALLCLLATGGRAGSAGELGSVALTKDKLRGAWRLERIEYTIAGRPAADPFYQPESTGLITYDASGWMSVHIVAPHRQGWKPAEARIPAGAAQDASLKAAAYDSYYAYFGTWTLDERASTVTHHVVTSLIPSESGLTYVQAVALHGDELTFTNHSSDHGRPATRVKIWTRAAAQ